MKKIIYILAIGLLSVSQVSKAQLADGSLAPDFTLTDLNGNSHNLYTYLYQGKTVFIDFFACHCPSCWAYHNQYELENLNAAHGPNGTLSQDVVVIAIEYDANNGTNEFYGISGNTQGDWITGTTYPFCNPEGAARQVLTDYNVVYYPLVYGICPDKILFNVGTQNATTFYNFALNCTSSGILNTQEPKALVVSLSNNTLFVRSKVACIDFSLYDVTGKRVIGQFIENTSESISVEHLSRGVYYYHASVNGSIFTGKIIK